MTARGPKTAVERAADYPAPFRRAEARCLPCPFCGGAAQILPQEHPDHLKESMRGHFKLFLVRCVECSVRKLVTTNHLKQVVAEWNHRTPPAPAKRAARRQPRR